MRTSILIDKNGNFVNGTPDLSISDNIVGMVFNNQISLEFVDKIIQHNNKNAIPDYNSVVTKNLNGSIEFTAKPTPYVPFNIQLENPVINITNGEAMLQFTGMCQSLQVTCRNVTGANYINIVLDRN